MLLKKLAMVRNIVFLSMVALSTVACTSTNLDNFNFLRKKQEAPKISYYPYLSKAQGLFLTRQNIIGLFPGYIIVPEHEDGSLEYQMNASSWWGLWPYEVEFLNYFFAEQAKRKLGCGPIKAGTSFTIKREIYTYKGKKISIAYPLTWYAKTDLPSMCQTKSYLELAYFEQESMYWDIPYSQNRIYP